jgi:putative phosphoribosyl transferase
VILVDDGVATGSTMLAAVRAIRNQEPDLLVVAAPVMARDTAELLAGEADEEVVQLLEAAGRPSGATMSGKAGSHAADF